VTSELFPFAIETDRLRLEPRTPEFVDLFEAYRICSSDEGIEDVTEYMPWNPHTTPQETREFLERGRRSREEATEAEYVVRPRAGEEGAGDIAGFVSLKLDWDRRTAELGVWLRQRFWGRGYSGERATALVELAFDRLDLEYVRVCHDVDNENSQRAIERYVDRLGGQRDCLIRNRHVFEGTPVDEYQYTISQEQWREAVGGEREAQFVDRHEEGDGSNVDA
jgi:RimJ/RimL family protein N-acetyltransferase